MKKLCFIRHSYHAKTKSSQFIVDYLKDFYEVTVLEDDSWRGEPYPDLSFIDLRYHAVVFWQSLPAPEIFKSINNENIVYFPMYDGVYKKTYNYWVTYQKAKIVNFSKTLHEKLYKKGFNSLYVQYFPRPQKFSKGKPDEVFFWQRLTDLNIKTVARLFAREDVKIHLHTAVDPHHRLLRPTAAEEKQFSITYSEWFDKKEDMWTLIKQKALYVSPREYEGIGMSFLEAMAMGKAVVAIDHPTMNEYIEHNKTGFLFNLRNPSPIDLNLLDQVQQNTYAYMQEGFKRWENDKQKIIDFMEERPKHLNLKKSWIAAILCRLNNIFVKR